MKYKKKGTIVNRSRFLPEINILKGKKVQWWDKETHEEVKSSIKSYDTKKWTRRKKDLAKQDKSRENQ